MLSKPPPALMSQSMTKEPAQHTKLPKLLLGALFVQMMSDWKHCEDQQKMNHFPFVSGALAPETITTI